MKIADNLFRLFLLGLFVTCTLTCNGQSNNTQAIVAYQQAEEAYAQGDYVKCSQLLVDTYTLLERGEANNLKMAKPKIYYLAVKTYVATNNWVKAKKHISYYFDNKKEDLSDSKYLEMVKAKMVIKDQINAIQKEMKPFVGRWMLLGDFMGFKVEYLRMPPNLSAGETFQVLNKQGEIIISYDADSLTCSVTGQAAYTRSISGKKKREKDATVYDYSVSFQEKLQIGVPPEGIYYHPFGDTFLTGGLNVSGVMKYSFKSLGLTGGESIDIPHTAVISKPHNQYGNTYISMSFVSEKQRLHPGHVLIFVRQ